MSIFDEQKNYKPFKYGNITDPLINAMWAGHWTVNEFSFISDINDFKVNLNDEEKEVFKKTMLLISQIEVAVKSYWSNIRKIFPRPEIADMGSVFGGVEVIHSRAYSEILNVLGFNDEFQNILNVPVVNGRVSYLNKYNDKPYTKKPSAFYRFLNKFSNLLPSRLSSYLKYKASPSDQLGERKNAVYSLILFTLFVENVSLFSQFYIVLAFNKFRGIFKDVANVVQYTSKEENLHAEGGMALINQVKKEHPEIFDEEFKNRIIEESKEALIAETKLIDWILADYSNEFIDKEILITYLKRKLNISLEKIGFEPIFEVDEEYAKKTYWMDDEVFAPALTDFFHKRPIEYQKGMKSFDVEELF